jgi:hypothetical protein
MFILVVARIIDGRRYGEIIEWNLTKKRAIELADKWQASLSERDKQYFHYEVKRKKNKELVYTTKKPA